MSDKKYQIIKTLDFESVNHGHLAIYEFDEFPTIEQIRQSLEPMIFDEEECAIIRRGFFIVRDNTSYKLRRWGLELDKGILSKE